MTDERTAVKTYVPAHQKQVWADHADELGLSTSEFVRTMVQAGRRDFELPDLDADGESRAEPDSGSDPGGSWVEDRVVAVVRDRGPVTYDDLVDAVADALEARLEDVLARLQEAGTVRHSGREGGYVPADD